MCTLVGFHQNSGLRFTYGNDPEIFSISIMEKVPEIQNDFRNDFFSVNRKFSEFRIVTEFRNVPEISGNFRNVLENRSGNFPEKSFRKFPERLVPELH